MIFAIIGAVLFLIFITYLLSIRGRKGHPGLKDLMGWSYAHRGLHREGVPENSMAAFRDALDAGYGIELDVHLLKDGNLAITHCKFIREDLNKAKLSLVELNPITGLTHQLRVQCAKRKFPILGDATYGNFAFNKRIRSASKINRLFLHCSKTELTINHNGKDIHFVAEAPLPDSFSSILDFNIEIAKIFRF
jgi:glycerophosphoryl diester phosphodiesterase